MNTTALEQTPPRLPCTLVTGATSGIGRALALQLADAGVPVIALGRNPEALRALAAHSPLVTPCAADLAQIDSLPALAARLVAQHPGLGCLVNNAAIQNDLRLDDARCDSACIRHEVDVNLVAPMVLTQSLLHHLQARGSACIVNLSSGLAHAPKRSAAVYSATKAGLHLFTQALRVQMEGTPVRVVEAVMPLVDTPMTAGRGRGKLPAEQAARQLIAGLRAGQADIRIGKARWLPWLQRWAPGVLARILQRG
ncbi:MAG: SDR family NAD(P)-dependent oxidoreductase [Burkholderiales bacterium]|nr:SDR family NAD(P)-dependent oxidoreductase [Burkholderiales bacterium]